MKKEKHQEIICILDKSGSMSPLAEETIKGLNVFLENQKTIEGSCHFSLIQFNHEITNSIARQPINQVEPLWAHAYRPEGLTALLDAIGITLNLFQYQNPNAGEISPPVQVLVFIITDGYENASKNYNKSQIKELITNLTNQGWEFQFFGANMDSFSEAGGLGIDSANSLNWEHNQKGMHFMINAMNEKTKSFRKAMQFFNDNTLPNKNHD